MIIEITMERAEFRTNLGHGDWDSEDIAQIVYRPIYSHVYRQGMFGPHEWLPEWGPPKEVRC